MLQIIYSTPSTVVCRIVSVGTLRAATAADSMGARVGDALEIWRFLFGLVQDVQCISREGQDVLVPTNQDPAYILGELY